MCLAVRGGGSILFTTLCTAGSTFSDDARLMRMLTLDESTGPGLEDRRIRVWKPGVIGCSRFTELDLDLVPRERNCFL